MAARPVHLLKGDVTLLKFLLSARKPEMYREHHVLQHTGAEGGPVQLEALDINLEALSERDLKMLQGILTRAEHAER